jgi:hypothetical protein
MLNRRHFLQTLAGGAAALWAPSKLIVSLGTGVRHKPPWVERVVVGNKVYTRGADGLLVVEEITHVLRGGQGGKPRWVATVGRSHTQREIEHAQREMRLAYAERFGPDALAEAYREAVQGDRARFEAHRKDLARLMLPGVTAEPRKWFSFRG